MRTNSRLFTSSLAVATVLVFAGCASEPPATVDEGPLAPAPGATPSPGENAGPEAGDQEAVTDAAITAIDLAESEAGGVAFELDDEDDNSAWKVDVNVNGDHVEVLVAWDGATVLGTERDGSVDNDDLDKLAQADVRLQEAIRSAAAEADGHVTSADLDTEDGAVAWKVEFDSGGNDREVYVDVSTGEILRIED